MVAPSKVILDSDIGKTLTVDCSDTLGALNVNIDGTTIVRDPVTGVLSSVGGGSGGGSTTVTNTVTGHKVADITSGGVTTTVNETITTLALAGSVITYTNESGSATTIDIKNAETTTTVTNTVTGHKIATYTNEDAVAVDINETVTSLSLNASNQLEFVDEAGITSTIDIPAGGAASSTILWENVTTNPSPSGNTGGPKFTYNTSTGDKYFVDSNGVASLIETGNLSGDIVYVDTTDPSTATIFSLGNPPVTNDPALAGVAGNVYIGSDGSVWSYNGTTYVTKTFAFQGASDEFTATAGQTSFTLTGIPKGKVWMFRNGARLPNASFSVVGTMVTYVPANNGSAALGALVAGDIIDIDYVK